MPWSGDSVLLIHSTVSPEVCEEMAAARGISVLDAPVSGSLEGALPESSLSWLAKMSLLSSEYVPSLSPLAA